MDQDSIQLFARWKDGDAAAAEELANRYTRRLIELARVRLSPRLAARVDAEDIVQSAYRSFFVRSRNGAWIIERSGDLWRLLSAITVNKVRRQVQHHTQQKRSIDRELSQPSSASSVARLAEFFVDEPAEPDVVAVTEELQLVMSQLSPRDRRILELRLQGEDGAVNAEEVSRSEWTIQRALQKIHDMLEGRILDREAPSG